MAVYEIPGRTFSFDKEGRKTVTITYLGDAEVFQLPKDLDDGPILSRTVVNEVSGQIRTTFVIQLPLTPQEKSNLDIPDTVVEIISSTRTVPIEAHPNFAEPYLLAKDIKFIKDRINELQSINALPDLSSTTSPDKAASLFGYLARGITSYYEPGVIVRKSYPAASPPSTKNVGKIDNPGVTVIGKPPKANFILTSIQAVGSKAKYQVTEEYEMSGPSGWDSFLYGSSS